MRSTAILFLLALQGCSSKSPTPNKPPEVISVTAGLSQGDTASVLRALSLSHQEATKDFGAHQLSISIQSKLSKEKEVAVSLQEDISLSADKDNTIFVESNNSQNEGFDAYLTKDEAAIAVRYGPLQPTSVAAVDAARDTAFSSVYANLEPLSPWLSFQPKPAREVAGKSGIVLAVSQREGKAPEASSLLPEKAWRSTIAPSSIEGELVIEPQSGFLLFADLHLQYTATRDAQQVSFDVTVKANLTVQGDSVATIKVPELEELPPRLRLEKERLDLIGKAALQQQKESKKKAPKPAIAPTSNKAPTSAPK